MASPFNRSSLHALCSALDWPLYTQCNFQLITSRIESKKLQMVIAQYNPLNDGAMNVLPKHEMMVSTMSDRSIKKGGMKRKSLNFT